MKEYERNAFGHVLNLAENSRNKSASLYCLDMETGLLFRVFPLFKLWTSVSPNIFKPTLADLFERERKDH